MFDFSWQVNTECSMKGHKHWRSEMKKTHLDLKKTVILFSTALGLTLVASTSNAAGGDTLRMKPSVQQKIKPMKPIAVSRKCASGFKKGSHQLGYSCTSRNATCTKPYFPENLKVSGNRFSYICRDPASVPK